MKTCKSVLFAGALLLSGTVTSADFPMTFEALDTNGDGYISNTEASARTDLKQRRRLSS